MRATGTGTEHLDGGGSVVVVGHGMVGHRFCERLLELDVARAWRITVLGEEPRPAYDRVHLTSYLGGKTAAELALADAGWYLERGIRLLVGVRATSLDRDRRRVGTSAGPEIAYDALVLATGSAPWVPPVPGIEGEGVFVYRTLEDLDAIREHAARCRTAAVIGGGLLGLEAAKALLDLGLETHVVECSPRLMPRQLDGAGATLLRKRIEALGVQVHLGATVSSVVRLGGAVQGLALSDGHCVDAELVIVSAGIRPRDELARDAGLHVAARGGVVVDDELRTSDPRVFAIGEVAHHRSVVYGLVGPGYEMADALAGRLTGAPRPFVGADTSTRLKLLGIDVASFGDPFADERTSRSIAYEDLVQGVYKKLALDESGTRVLGGMLVGDSAQFPRLVHAVKTEERLDGAPESLLFGGAFGSGSPAGLPDATQICSCNNVTKAQILCVVRERSLTTVGEVKSCTRAGTGCGGCLPLVGDVVAEELRAAGKSVRPRLCEHFAFTRQELYEVAKIRNLRSFGELLASHGSGSGCEVCKPAVASILASLFNDPVLDHATIQDTNDRFLANVQRGGLYSVVPRIPGGEITPDKLIVLGQVAKRYGLYTKITGGQRIDLLGAKLNDLPDIWQALVDAGFESGHAYGKAVRTVKSCVGTTWCRYGVQDSVAFAIRIENRYKGIRAPHKLKSAVSGCTRECAEAQSKDFGVIATEKGWNVYVCGNGGMKPRHADLLAADLDEDTVVRILDRFLAYYIATADRLTRTSVWLDKMEGGIDRLREVILDDRLGICAELEQQMQRLVDTYRCEWADVVQDPDKRARFRHFANSTEPDDTVELVVERQQSRPADWAPPPRHLPVLSREVARSSPKAAPRVSWVRVAHVADVPRDGGVSVKYGRTQLAVFHFASQGRWYATQNMCPHRKDMVLSRGLLGDQGCTPKVACPLHKKTFSLETGECLSGDPYRVHTFPVKVEGESVLVELPSEAVLEALLEPDEPRWATPIAAE